MPSKIPWTDETLNVCTGCQKISEGCKNCYAEELHTMRHKAYKEGKLQNIPQYAKPFNEIQLHPERLEQPLHWKKPRKIFVNSMSDLFHESVPFEFVKEVVHIALDTPHILQILTKRTERMYRFVKWYVMSTSEQLPKNIWLGTTVENQDQANKRTKDILQIPAAVRFLSVEPMLEGLDFSTKEPVFVCHKCGWKGEDTGENYSCPICQNNETWEYSAIKMFDWVICGCESGKNRRPISLDAVRNLRDQCKEAGVLFFMKQLEINGKVTDNLEDFPIDLQIREYPNA